MFIVGIDLGVKDLIVTSSGEKYKNPKEIKRYEKRISKLYSKLKNSRKHNIIKIVNKLIKKYDIIISEKLDIKNMTYKNNLTKSRQRKQVN